MRYIYVLLYWQPYIEYLPHQHPSVCFLCIISPLFTVSIPNWLSVFLSSIRIISCLLFLPPFLCYFSTSAYQTGYFPAKTHNIKFSFFSITPSFIPLKEVISQYHVRPSQQLKVLAPTVLLPVQIILELLKVWSGILTFLVFQIRPPLADLPCVCHHPLSK